ncbi:MAG: hypothetical protein IJR77_00560 [Bacteroidales bacterium]|nr:hypothetical protein [Bacteroidales bacterium]
MEAIIILLLSLCLVVGILVLLTVNIHFRQWKRSKQPAAQPYDPTPKSFEALLASAMKPLSPMERRYLRLFLEEKTTEEIAAAMHVEPSSVYTMKYRIRKKFPADFSLPF